MRDSLTSGVLDANFVFYLFATKRYRLSPANFKISMFILIPALRAVLKSQWARMDLDAGGALLPADQAPGRWGGPGEGVADESPSLLSLVGRLADKFAPGDRAEGDPSQGRGSRRWRARARKVCMEIVLARGQTLLSRSEDADADPSRDDEIIADLLAVRLRLARLEKRERSGDFLADRPRAISEEEGRAATLDRLLDESAVPDPVLRLLLLLSPHAGARDSEGRGKGLDVLDYNRGLGTTLNGFLPSKAKGLVRVPRMIDEASAVEKENVLLDDDGGRQRGALFLETRSRLMSELGATTSGANAAASLELPWLPPSALGDRKASYFAGTVQRLPARPGPKQPPGRALNLPQSGDLVVSAGIGSEASNFGGLLRMMERGFLASEVDLSHEEASHIHRATKGQPKAEIEVVRDLVSILRGSLHFIPKLMQSRLCWADYVSTQTLCMDFVRVGAAHHNLKCLINTLQGIESDPMASLDTSRDPITQAFAQSVQSLLLVIDAEIERVFNSRAGPRPTHKGSSLAVKDGGEVGCAHFASLSVSEFHCATALIRSQILALAALCGCAVSFPEIKADPSLLQTMWKRVHFPVGADLLDYLYQMCEEADGPERQVYTHIFFKSLNPMLRQIHETSFRHLRMAREAFVEAHGCLLDEGEGEEDGWGAALGMRLPSFLRGVAWRVRLSFLQYNILKEFDHCAPLLSFMERFAGDLTESGEFGVSPGLTLDAVELERIRNHQATVSSVTTASIDELLGFLRGKRELSKMAALAASRAKILSIEKSAQKMEEEILARSRVKTEERRRLADELKSAAAAYSAAKKAAKSAEREADRLRMAEESHRRAEMIAEASGILREQAALRMQRIQKEIDRLQWRRKRMELQPKRLAFDQPTPEKKNASPADESDPEEPPSVSQDGDPILESDPTPQQEEEEEEEAREPSPLIPDDNASERLIVSDFVRRIFDKVLCESAETCPVEEVDGAPANEVAPANEEDAPPAEPTNLGGSHEEADLGEATPQASPEKEEEEEATFGSGMAAMGLEAPLAEAIQVCILQRVALQYNCISRLCVRYFLEEEGLFHFFQTLTRRFFLRQGDSIGEDVREEEDAKIPWPFSLVVTRELVQKYQDIRTHLRQLRSVEAQLVLRWQGEQLLRRRRMDGIERKMEACLTNEMLNFIQKMLSLVSLSLQSEAEAFQKALRADVNLVNLAHVSKLHQEFLDRCTDCCFLRRSADAAVRNLVDTAIQSILELVGAEFTTWEARNRFRNASQSLNKILTNL